MKKKGFRERIRLAALDLIERTQEGLRFSELARAIRAEDSEFKPNTIVGAMWNLETVYPERVYKPSKGLFRAVKFRSTEADSTAAAASPREKVASKAKEEAFYEPFAMWLKNEVEDATHAIPLGGNVFKDKWGTPDVIGKKESRRTDIIKGQTEIVSAEIKTDSMQLITAFGQTCSYKLFSHKVYLVVPQQSHKGELDRLDSLCQIFGIGLVTFDVKNVKDPGFRILVRPSKHEPDLFYTNLYLSKIEKKLFS